MQGVEQESGGTVLVFGVTGQQGGAVARALHDHGWAVRGFVRDASTPRARSLDAWDVEVVEGNLGDAASLRAAMAGVQRVFSVQPSSGQGAVYGVSDADEIRYGRAVADIALQSGVRHLVYSSANAAGDPPSGMGHFDSKREIERHLATLDLPHTILRPSAFMEILMLPGMGLDTGAFSFLMRDDQPMQFIAVDDIGRIAATVFAEPQRYIGKTL